MQVGFFLSSYIQNDPKGLHFYSKQKRLNLSKKWSLCLSSIKKFNLKRYKQNIFDYMQLWLEIDIYFEINLLICLRLFSL